MITGLRYYLRGQRPPSRLTTELVEEKLEAEIHVRPSKRVTDAWILLASLGGVALAGIALTPVGVPNLHLPFALLIPVIAAFLASNEWQEREVAVAGDRLWLRTSAGRIFTVPLHDIVGIAVRTSGLERRLDACSLDVFIRDAKGPTSLRYLDGEEALKLMDSAGRYVDREPDARATGAASD